jgi:hypothetical protein
MSHIITRKLISTKRKVFGRDWWYDFRDLPEIADRTKATKFVDSLFQQSSAITKSWNADVNSEWIVRCYLAARLIMASTLYINSYRHCMKVNQRVPATFLQYYSVLFAMRAAILTSPKQLWNNGELVGMTHSKAINVSCDILKCLTSSSYADGIKGQIAEMKGRRELISYIAPSRGDGDIELLSDPGLIALCTLFSEIAQLQSEVLETSLHKKAPDKSTLVFKREFFHIACTAVCEDSEYVDHEDAYRLDYLRRKHPLMTNLYHIISEGHSEDFFGSWLPKDEDADESESTFNPDKDWQIIFDIP